MSEVATTAGTAVSTEVRTPRGAAENLDGAEDVLMPFISLMQGSSDLVKARKAMIGEFRESAENRVLAEPEKLLGVIVFDSLKTWKEEIVRHGEKRGKFKRQFAFTAENRDLELEEPIAEGTLVRTMVWTYYVLLADEDSRISTPYSLSVSKTSKSAAKTMGLFFSRMARAEQDSWAYVIDLSSKEKMGSNGSYLVVDVHLGRETTEAEKKAAEYWYGLARAGRIKQQAEDDDAEVVTGSGAPKSGAIPDGDEVF